MAAGKQSQSRQVPLGLAGPGGFPWSRLVIGVIALVLSATVSWRAGRPAPELARSEAPALAVQAAGAAPLDLPPMAAAPAQSAQSAPQPEPALVEQAPQEKPAAIVPAAIVPAAGELQHTSTHPKAQVRRHSRAKASPATHSARHAARAKLVRSGPGPRDEYLASRDEVAALTGEDSGSAYLSQLAARRHAAAAKPVVHAQAGAQARRATLRRS